MNQLAFIIKPSPETNDHELRVLIDGVDVLGEGYLGLDPPVFFRQDFEQAGELMIGRCSCGCEGCCDYPVSVRVDEKFVSWTADDGTVFHFDRTSYQTVLDRARQDHRWEDANRTAERIAGGLLTDTMTRNNARFKWASARIKPGYMTLCYEKKQEQEIFEIQWTEGDIEASIGVFLVSCQIKR